MDNHILAPALKNASDGVKNRFYDNLSKNRAQMLKEEIEFLGKIRLSEVQEAQQKIAQTVRTLQENGQLHIVHANSDDIFL